MRVMHLVVGVGVDDIVERLTHAVGGRCAGS